MTDKNDVEIDSVFWEDLNTNETLERKKYEHGDTFENTWQKSYEPGGTPGKENSKPKIYSHEIELSELFPAPSEKSRYPEYIEFYNFGKEALNLKNWKLRDANLEKNKKDCILTELSVAPESYAYFYPENCLGSKISINNTQGENIYFYDPNSKLVSETSYSGSAKDDLSYNFDGKKWRWSKFLTPGEENKFNNIPVVKTDNDDNAYVNVYADFSAKGYDKDKDRLKFTWDFGDGHKSYKKEARHKYLKAGEYAVTLKVSDGSEDKIETFKIEVKKYPHSKVRLVSLSPNPGGKDSDNEWIEIENKSKKKVNLKGWSIATGWEKLYNHPILEDFIIKPGKAKILTRDFSRFTLNNKKVKIELRYPDGEAADKVKYKEKKSIVEDMVYKKSDKKKWQWIATPEITEDKLEEKTALVTDAAIPHEDTQMEFNNAELTANLGNYSENPDWQKKQEHKIVLASFNSKYNLPESQGRVLGVSTIKNYENRYFFTFPAAPKPHWTIKIVENILSFLNALFNKIILNLAG